MAKVADNSIIEGGRDDYTQDGTVSLKGRPILRSKTGRWRACSFIVVYEVFERIAYFGISTNLVLFLTNQLHEGTVNATNNVTNWVGTVWVTPILGAYIADAYLGRYWTFIIASVVYLAGMSLLTLAVSVPALRPPQCGHGVKEEDCERASSLQVATFYCALYIIAIGAGGTKPNISTMGADQFDDFEPKEKTQKLSFFNWWMFSIFFANLFTNTFLIYIQDNVGWVYGYGLPTLGLLFSIWLFLLGTPFYRHKLPTGSPVTRMAMVLVAALRNWKVPLPNDPIELYELSWVEYTKVGKLRIHHTPSLRFLDKAAIRTGSTSPWMLSPVTQVEETKQMFKMLPILISTFIPSATLAQAYTLSIKQATTLDRSIGPHFQIPPACVTAFVTVFLLISLVLYDRLLVPNIRKYTHNPRGITLLQRLGIGLVLNFLIMIVAFLGETKRLKVATENHILGQTEIVPLSIFLLIPQYALTGVTESFVETAKLEFFYDQAPVGMKSLGTSYFTTSLGIGSFLSSFILTTVSSYTERNGRKGWILDNLNVSHLDYYYAVLGVLCFLNLFFFFYAAKSFVYNAEVSGPNRGLVFEEDKSSNGFVGSTKVRSNVMFARDEKDKEHLNHSS